MLNEVKTAQNLLLKLKDLLFEYTWCIPSATNDSLNDISLYDHSISTMTISLALACSDNKDNPFVIFAADVSGIQQFIFQSKYASFSGAAKIFRARSFIINSISTAYKLEVSKALDIIPFFDLIDAGGKFTFMLPNLDNIDSKLDKLQEEQELFFINNYLGTLCVLVDYSVKVSTNALLMENFRQTLSDVSFNLNKKKSRKFEKVLNLDNWILNDIDVDNKKRCTACGTRTTPDEYCSNCNEQYILGGDIPQLKNISFIDSNNSTFQLTKNIALSYKKDDKNTFSLVDSDLYPRWRINNYTPENESFSDIASDAVVDGIGKNFLAYIKIDVDNMGELFYSGIPDDIYSLSRYITISRMFNQFFNTTVKSYIKEKFSHIYTVISGGDDLFVIAPWNQAIEFVLNINDKFNELCCNNAKLHFSTGIVVSGCNTPFALVNEESSSALDDKAKEEENKNSICYFDTIFSYDELRLLLTRHLDIMRFISDEKIKLSHGFIYRVYNYINDRLSNNEMKNYSSYSQLHYDLARNVIEKKNSDKISEVAEFFLQINKMNKKELEQYRVMLIHTLYSIRKS